MPIMRGFKRARDDEVPSASSLERASTDVVRSSPRSKRLRVIHIASTEAKVVDLKIEDPEAVCDVMVHSLDNATHVEAINPEDRDLDKLIVRLANSAEQLSLVRDWSGAQFAEPDGKSRCVQITSETAGLSLVLTDDLSVPAHIVQRDLESSLHATEGTGDAVVERLHPETRIGIQTSRLSSLFELLTQETGLASKL
jgi:hypothetical protein